MIVVVGLFLSWFFGVDLVKVREVHPPAQATGRFVDVAGVKTYYQVKGQGPAVLLLHGTGASGYSWRNNIASLAERFTVYAPDMPGYGYSAKPDTMRWSRNLAQWASDFLTAVGVDKAAVVGHSLGGEVALWLAVDHPDQVDRLVLVDAAGVGPLTGSFRLAATPVLGEIMLKATGEPVLRHLMSQAYVNKEPVTDEMVSLYHRFLWSPGARDLFLARLRRYDRDIVTLQAHLSQLKRPVLAVWGDQDPYFGLEIARKLVAQVEGTELVVIEQSGHVPHEERPERFNQIVRDWLLGQPVR